MNENDSNVYSEVVTILKNMDIKYIDKIPKEYYELFETCRNVDYNPSIGYLEKNANEKTLLIISMLNYKFWTTAENREKLKKFYQEVDLIKEKEKTLKYNPNVFGSQPKNEKLPVVYEKKNRIQKIIEKIRKIFLKH